jgi:hypothetical protein
MYRRYNNAVSPIAITPLEINDKLRLHKPHACGGFDWLVVRVGADIGLKCCKCGRRVLLARRELERRIVSHTPVTEEIHGSDKQEIQES